MLELNYEVNKVIFAATFWSTGGLLFRQLYKSKFINNTTSLTLSRWEETLYDLRKKLLEKKILNYHDFPLSSL